MSTNSKSITLMVVFAGFANACIDDKDSSPPSYAEFNFTDDDGYVLTNKDNCPGVVNNDQMDNDQDGQGDACDNDDDNDGVLDGVDNCKWNWNADQANWDQDGQGDACDNDDDNDGVCDPGPLPDHFSLYVGTPVCTGWDNCQNAANPGQEDLDDDDWGDACDNDRDSDLVRDEEDNCPDHRNYDQKDMDGDGWGDVCDNDDDGDGICDPGPAPLVVGLVLVQGGCTGVDNCPNVCNPDQTNTDWNDDNNATVGDLFGDACDTDPEGDGTEDNRWYPNVACDDDSNCTGQNPLIFCDDDSNCTTDSCSEGDCVNTAVGCDDNNACTTDSCDDEDGCLYASVTTDDNNMCTTDACDPNTGVSHVPIVCNDNNASTTDTCVPASGCVYTPIVTCTVATQLVDCNDNNACTTDSCSDNTCQHSAVSIDDSNMCTTDACDPNTGVSHVPIVCNDNNASTTDTCVPATGCLYTPMGSDFDYDGYAACVSTPNGTCDCDDVGSSGGAPASFCRTGNDGFLVIAWAAVYGSRPTCPEGSTLVGATDGSFLNGPQVAGHETGGDAFDNDCDGSTDEAEPGLDNCTFIGLGGGVTRVDCPWMDMAPTLPPQAL